MVRQLVEVASRQVEIGFQWVGLILSAAEVRAQNVEGLQRSAEAAFRTVDTCHQIREAIRFLMEVTFGFVKATNRNVEARWRRVELAAQLVEVLPWPVEVAGHGVEISRHLVERGKRRQAPMRASREARVIAFSRLREKVRDEGARAGKG